MTKNVVIIDYGMGNLFSVSQAFQHCGANVTLTSDASVFERADLLVLPGVGAFREGMQEIKNRGFVEPIQNYAKSGRAFLGVCLGMQMLLDESEEFGTTAGLGMIPGKVVAIPKQTAQGEVQRVPHIGWNRVESCQPDPAILAGLPAGSAFYFVHSYAGKTQEPEDTLAFCTYGGHKVTAMIQRENILGCQFHPEKSGKAGLQIIRNLLCQL